MSHQQQITNQLRKAKTKPTTKPKGLKKAKQSVTEQQLVIPQAENDDIIQLKQFDLDTKFGPSLGLTRLERWERANQLGLQPPPKVQELIENNCNSSECQGAWPNVEVQEMLPTVHAIGPIAVTADATSWQDYVAGVIQHHCPHDSGNHAVQIVGYNMNENPPYWIVRYSWGTWLFKDRNWQKCLW